MAEPETGIDPEDYFSEGFAAGQEAVSDELREQIAEQLSGEGFDPDDIEEALYDPAPRRRGRKHRGTRRMRRAYDPAPRRRSRKGKGRRMRTYAQTTGKNGYRRRAKGMLGKLKQYAMPGAAGVTFFAAYSLRAKQLNMSLMDAIMYDVKNFDSTAAMKRVQDNAGEIATPLIAGWAVKKTGIAGKYSALAGDILTGLGIGKAAKTILDPPITAPLRTEQRVQEIREQPQAMTTYRSPWA